MPLADENPVENGLPGVPDGVEAGVAFEVEILVEEDGVPLVVGPAVHVLDKLYKLELALNQILEAIGGLKEPGC